MLSAILDFPFGFLLTFIYNSNNDTFLFYSQVKWK